MQNAIVTISEVRELLQTEPALEIQQIRAKLETKHACRTNGQARIFEGSFNGVLQTMIVAGQVRINADATVSIVT